MNPTKRSILALWRKNPGWSLSVKNIRAALDASKPQYPQIREILAGLVERGELVERRNGFVRDPSAPAAEPKSQGKQKGTAKPGRKKPGADAQVSAAGAENGRIGFFSAHPNGFGFVDTPNVPEGVMIPAKYIGGALDGDRVRIESLPARGSRREAGQIVEVVERRRTSVRGVLKKEYGQWWLTPVSEKLPLVFLAGEGTVEGYKESPPNQGGEGGMKEGTLAEGTLAEAEITHFPEHHDEAPEGKIIRVFGENGTSLSAVIDHILHDLDLSEGFSSATRTEMDSLVKQEKKAAPKKAAPKNAGTEKAGTGNAGRGKGKAEKPGATERMLEKGREDLSHLPFVTIDGEDARDFDDAVCLETLAGGKRRLWVAIADVGAYVKPGTAVDEDAYRKGTSVYLPRRVLPMLPRLLSDNLCSLKPKQARRVLTCEMTFNSSGHRTGHRLFEAVIESKARLTYTAVQRWFEKKEGDGIAAGLLEMLTAMRALAAQLRKMRDARGAVGFVFPEIQIDLNKNGEPKGFRETFSSEATRLIEQFMLEANETVAEHCQLHGLPVLYRVHDPPKKIKLTALTETLWNFNLEVKKDALSTPQGISDLLASIAEHPQREQVELTILKAMNQAQYRARNDGHFALAAENYCHFTSPIRRYPDLVVHRALKASFRGGKNVPTSPAEAGNELSVRERTAADAESRVKRLYMVVFMEPRLGEVFGATVNSVGEHGLWLRLREFPVNGLLPAASLPGGQHFDRKGRKLVSRARGRNFAIGDRLTVTLARADRLAQQLDFEFVKLGWEGE